MGKAVYYVSVIRKDMEGEYRALGGTASSPAGGDSGLGFVEPVRASNRREAFVLVKRKYPDHLVLDDAVKESSNVEKAAPKDRAAFR